MKTEKRAKREIEPTPAPSSRSNGAGVRRRQRTDTRLEITPGQPDLTALRSVTQEWLVPRLVQEFLRERGIELKQPPMSVNYENPIPKLLIRGGRGASRREG
jgi:hypothetical protein